MIYAFDRETSLIPIVYEDFSACENIRPVEGRLPEHDNEIALAKLFTVQKNLKVGDDITLESNNVKKNYIISGIISSVTNNGQNVYMTESAIKGLMPAYRPSAVEVFLEDGTDRTEFQTRLMQTYGRSVADTQKADGAGETEEDRIRAAAEQKIAEYLAEHGADHIEYSIQIGDKVISGSSDSFVIKNVQSPAHIIQTQIGGYFHAISITSWALMGISAVVSMIIIAALMEQTVRRQRRELGIMLGLGYTTKELMFQLAFRIMPAVIFAVLLGTAGAVAAISGVMEAVIGAMTCSVPLLAAAVVIMILFCFGCAYLGAGRIKKISVTELMTE